MKTRTWVRIGGLGLETEGKGRRYKVGTEWKGRGGEGRDRG